MINWKIVIQVYIDRSITKVSIELPETGRKPLKKNTNKNTIRKLVLNMYSLLHDL